MLTRLLQSWWLIALVAIGLVVAVVHAVLAKPQETLNWIGVALWIVLLAMMLIRRRRQPPPPRGRSPRRRPRR